MKTLSDLKATVTDTAGWPCAAGVTASLFHELAPGCFVHLQLTEMGLRIFRGATAVALPLDCILAAATAAEPALVTAPPAGGIEHIFARGVPMTPPLSEAHK